MREVLTRVPRNKVKRGWGGEKKNQNDLKEAGIGNNCDNMLNKKTQSSPNEDKQVVKTEKG